MSLNVVPENDHLDIAGRRLLNLVKRLAYLQRPVGKFPITGAWGIISRDGDPPKDHQLILGILDSAPNLARANVLPPECVEIAFAWAPPTPTTPTTTIIN